jgi:ketosteroid isomerase-like protein
MADHPNAVLLRNANDAMEAGDMQQWTDMVADDVVWHEIGRDEPIRGKQALLERFSSMSGDAKFTGDTHDIVANDEHTVALVNANVTMGDQSISYRTAEIYHIRDGKITERWAFSDDTERINRFFGGM